MSMLRDLTAPVSQAVGGGAKPSLASLLEGFSLEITAKDRERFLGVRKLLPAGTCISITFLPGDDVGDLAATAAHVRALGFVPVPHISARRLRSAAELHRFLRALRDEAGVDRAFVVAGDLPQPLGPYADAHAVLETGRLAEYGVKVVGIGGYPEGHPQIESPALWRALHDKCVLIEQQGLKPEIVTQFAFDAGPVVQWIRDVEAAGIEADIRIGAPGPTSVQALLKFAARCGVSASTKILTKYGISITRLLTTATPDAFLRDLASQLDPHARRVRVHLYPFGGLEKAAAWAAAAGANSANEDA